MNLDYSNPHYRDLKPEVRLIAVSVFARSRKPMHAHSLMAATIERIKKSGLVELLTDNETTDWQRYQELLRDLKECRLLKEAGYSAAGFTVYSPDF